MKNDASARILESRVICRQPDRYIGWPTIARTATDELVVVFSGDRDHHVCPYGKTWLMRSKDNGHTWSRPEVINNTPVDDRDTGLCACPDGTLVVSWFTAWYDPAERPRSGSELVPKPWEATGKAPSAQDVDPWITSRYAGETPRGHWTRRSPDGGHTWEAPVRGPGTAPHGPICLRDGRLLFVGNSGYDRPGRTTRLVAAESRDSGRSWAVIGSVSMFPVNRHARPDELGYLGEPHVVEAADGRLVGMARFEVQPYREERRACYLWQFESADGGRTWTEPRETPILGKPPHLLRLRDGRLLVSYGYRHTPYGERACFSHDHGRNWDTAHEIILRDDAPSSDLGYPATAECADGTLLTVYYQQDKPGEKTCLMTTRWQATK